MLLAPAGSPPPLQGCREVARKLTAGPVTKPLLGMRLQIRPAPATCRGRQAHTQPTDPCPTTDREATDGRVLRWPARFPMVEG